MLQLRFLYIIRCNSNRIIYNVTISSSFQFPSQFPSQSPANSIFHSPPPGLFPQPGGVFVSLRRSSRSMCPRMMRVRRVSNANRPGSCSMRSGLQSSATTSIPSVGGAGRKGGLRESRGGIAMGKTGEEAPKKREFFQFSSPFSAKIPLFSPAMRRPKTLTRSGKEIGAEKTSRPTESTHDLREQTEGCPPPKARWRAAKRIAREFSPIETQRRVRKWLSGA